MSKKQPLTGGLTEEQINESFEEALEKGEVTDVLGNPIDLEAIDINSEYNHEEKDLNLNLVLNNLKVLQGKVLTVIDATADKEKCKFVKDIIRDAFVQTGELFVDVVGRNQ